jgi:predicted ATP-dependent endonuclease of OLD family
VKLTKVIFKNYRSIKDLEFSFEPSFKILVGINESGKSNILKGLHLLSNDASSSIKDKRFALEDESPIKEAYVRFVFTLHKSDIEQIEKQFYGLFDKIDKNTKVLIGNKTSYSTQEFLNKHNQGLCTCNILTGNKTFQTWAISPGTYTAVGKFKRVNPKSSSNPEIIIDSTARTLNEFKFISEENAKKLPDDSFEEATPEHVCQAWSMLVNSYAKENTPDCIYWRYEDSYLLPSKIDKNEFKNNPDACLPLRYLFELAGEWKIRESIDLAEKDEVGLRNLLRRVATKATKHLHAVWKEYDTIKIILTPDGENINALIQDKFNEYDFEKRSDGFKRFISFLIIVSSQVKAEAINNTLILIDEPEIGLHPSGVRYLRDELIKMSQTNQIVASTHSIFMIDKDLIDRHVHVKKTNETTEIIPIGYSNIAEEEVVFKALGFSIFEIIKENNIIFEGWGDKAIYLKALERVPNEHSSIKAVLKPVGVCYMGGLRNQKSIISMLELANRKYRIISDNDETAKITKRDYKGDGAWHTYADLCPSLPIKTVEDFLKEDIIIESTNTIIESKSLPTPKMTLADLSVPGHREDQIKRYIATIGLNQDEAKLLLKEIKETIYTQLKSKNILPDYFIFLSALANKIESEE